MIFSNLFKYKIHIFLIGFFFGFIYDFTFPKFKKELSKNDKTILSQIIFSNDKNFANSVLSNIQLSNILKIQIYLEKKKSLKNIFNFSSEWYFITKDQVLINQKKLKIFMRNLNRYQNESFLCVQENSFLITKFQLHQSQKCLDNYQLDGLSVFDSLKQCVGNLSRNSCPTELQRFILNIEEFFESKSDFYLKTWPIVNTDSEHQLDIIKNIFNILEIQDDIKKYEQIINHSPLDCDNSEQWPLGLNTPKKNPSPHSHYGWKYFDNNFSYDYSSTIKTLDENFRDILEQIRKLIIKTVGSKYSLKRILNGYRLDDPWYGTYYLIDAAIQNRESKKYSIEQFNLMHPFTQTSVQLFEKGSSNKIIILVPFTKMNLDFENFLKNLENNLFSEMSSIENIQLVYVTDSEQQLSIFFKIIQKFKSINSKIIFRQVVIKSEFFHSVYFHQLVALENVLSSLSESSLILVVPLNTVLKKEFIYIAIENTLEKSRVFFPVSFDLFNSVLKSKMQKKILLSSTGYFNQYSFEIGSFYVSDYLNIRNRLNSSVLNERKSFYELFESYSNLFLFRTIEKNLIKQSPDFISCETKNFTKNEHENCLLQKNNIYGDKNILKNFLIEQKKKIIFY